jgi:hypothetical protein
LAEDAIVQSHSAAPLERAGRPASGRTIHGKGRHLVEIGPPAIDLVTHDARHASAGHVAVDGVIGLGFLPSLANLLAHRMLSGIFLYGAAEVDQMADGWSRMGWLVVQTKASGPVFTRGTLEGEGGVALGSTLEKMRAVIPVQLLDRALGGIAATDAAKPRGYMGVLVVSGPHELVGELLEVMRSLSPEAKRIDFPGRIADALRNGVPMEVEDLKYLYGLELRTWAPTSERSRSQAGYGVY